MSNTNKAKAEQLGMPWGTAANRLRKQILFALLVRYGDNTCYRCGEEINDVSDLTVEHKEPWFNVDPELFWDLDNIAFSHAKCNRPHKHGMIGNTEQRNSGPEGTAWCSTHKDFIPIESFWNNSSRWNGLQKDCIECIKSARGGNR